MCEAVSFLPNHMAGILYPLGKKQEIYSYVSKPKMVAHVDAMRHSKELRNILSKEAITIKRKDMRGNDSCIIRRKEQPAPRSNNTIAIRRTGREKKDQMVRNENPRQLKRPFTSTNYSKSTTTTNYSQPNKKINYSKSTTALVNIQSISKQEDKHVQTRHSARKDKPTNSTKAQDKETQIAMKEAPLFSFDQEMSLVVEAMVSRTLEHSLLEIMEEEEHFFRGW